MREKLQEGSPARGTGIIAGLREDSRQGLGSEVKNGNKDSRIGNRVWDHK